MFCPTCGTQVGDRQRICGHCNANLPGQSGDDGLAYLLPVKTSGWAIASGYLGLFSLLLLPAPFALGTGIMALRHLSRNPDLHGRVRAWVGIVLGGLGCLGLAMAVIAMVASH